MVDISEVFLSGGVNPRSHCLAACRKTDRIVCASDIELVVRRFPGSESDYGNVTCISSVEHTKSIATVKRLKEVSGTGDMNEDEYFTSGGVDGRVVLWRLPHNESESIEAVASLNACDGAIGVICGTVMDQRVIISASWVGERSGFRIWWVERQGDSWTNQHHFDVPDMDPSFVLAVDVRNMSNGGIILAVGTSQRFIQLYTEDENQKSFSKVLSVAGHSDWIHSLCFNENSPSILLASAGQDTLVKLWRIEEDDKREEDEELTVTKNKFIVKGANDLAMRISVEAVLAGHDDWVHSTEWDREGVRLVSSSSDKTIIVWQESNQLWTDSVRLGIVGGQAAGFFSAAFAPEGNRIVASSYFGGLHMWIAEDSEGVSWKPLPICGGHVGEVRDVCWDPAGHYLISVGQDQTTRVYSMLKGTKNFAEIGRPQVHGHDLQCVANVSSACFVSGAEEKILRAFTAPMTFAHSLCSISDKDFDKVFGGYELVDFGARVPALGLSNKAIEEDAEPEKVEDQHWEEAAFLANPQNLTYAPTEDFLMQSTLWPEAHKLYGHGHDVYAVAVSPDGATLATTCKASQTDDAVIMFWNTKTWERVSQVSGHQLTVTQIEWSPNGKFLLSVSRDRTAVLYRNTTGEDGIAGYTKSWESKKEHSRIIWACSWAEDSQHFTTASRDMKLILWKVDDESATASPLASYKAQQPITAVAVSRGSISDCIVAAGLQDGSLIFLRLTDGGQFELIKKYLERNINVDSCVLRLRFGPSTDTHHQLLAYAGTDGKTRILSVSL